MKRIFFALIISVFCSCLHAQWFMDDGIPPSSSGTSTTTIGGDVYKANANTFTNTNTFSGQTAMATMSGEALTLTSYFWGADQILTGFSTVGGALDVTGQSTVSTMSGEAITLTSYLWGKDIVLSGFQTIAGSLNVTGTLDATGTATLTGISCTNVNAATTVTTVEFIGTTLDISGNAEVAGVLKFDAASANPQIYQGTDTNTGISFTGEDGFLLQSGGVKVFGVDNTQKIRLGDGTNNVCIGPDGHMTFEGTATFWKNIGGPLANAKAGVAGVPDFIKLKDNGASSTGVFAYHFDKNTQEYVFSSTELNNQWKEGTDIILKVHWSPVDAGAGDVVWGVEYTWQNEEGNFGNTTIMTAAAASDSTAYKHNYDTLGTISGSGKTEGGILLYRVFRNATHSTDDYDNDAVLYKLDIYIECDKLGVNTSP